MKDHNKTIVSGRLRHLLISNSFANPFDSTFSVSQIVELLDKISKDEETIIEILKALHEMNQNIKASLDQIIKTKLQLPYAQFLNLLFLYSNERFIIIYNTILHSEKKKSSLSVEKFNFQTVQLEEGVEGNLDFALTITYDILAKAIKLIDKTKVEKNISFTASGLKAKYPYLNILFYLINIRLNLSDFYKQLTYEAVYISEYDKLKIRLKYLWPVMKMIKTVGEIRAKSLNQESILYLNELNNRESSEEIGLSQINIDEYGIITLKIDKIIQTKPRRENIIANFLTFHECWKSLKLKYFDNITLADLFIIYSYLTELIEKTSENILKNKTKDIPSKINKTELENYLTTVTKFSILAITQFLKSITLFNHSSSIWKAPLYHEEDYYYIPILPIQSPNMSLIADQLISDAGYNLFQRQKIWKEFYEKEFRSIYKTNYRFEIIPLKDLGVDNHKSEFDNFTIIRTSKLLLITQFVVFNYSIESEEYEKALICLHDATIKSNNFKSLIKNNPYIKEEHLEPLFFITSYYPGLSGLILDEIPITDIFLLNNYVNVGAHKRAKYINQELIGFAEWKYYLNEEEFNSGFKDFLEKPFLVHRHLKMLNMEEHIITPENLTPHFAIETLNYYDDTEELKYYIELLSNDLHKERHYDNSSREKEQLRNNIHYFLTHIFNLLSYSEYKTYRLRYETYESVLEAKKISLAYFMDYIIKQLPEVSMALIKDDPIFEFSKFDSSEVEKLLDRILENSGNEIQLSEFKISIELEEKDERALLSYLIIGLNEVNTPVNISDEEIQGILIHIAILSSFRHKYPIKQYLYSSLGGVVDTLNFNHRYQPARDLCEDILMLSIKDKDHTEGWLILFKNYITQNNSFFSSIYGCILIASLGNRKQILKSTILESLNSMMKYFRALGAFDFVATIYQALDQFEISKFEKLKYSSTYFNSMMLAGHFNKKENIEILLNFISENISIIKQHGSKTIPPWIAMLYNLTFQFSHVGFDKKFIGNLIFEFEENLDKEIIIELRNKIFGNEENEKERFIKSLLYVYETREWGDLIYEIENLSVPANHLIRYSLKKDDWTGILLAGIVLNDSSLNYPTISIQKEERKKLFSNDHIELKSKFENYQHFLLSNLNLNSNQILIWLFESEQKIYKMSISADRKINIIELTEWNLKNMNSWLNTLDRFYYNSKKNKWYDYQAQENDYIKYKKELSFSNIQDNDNKIEEILYCSTMLLSEFPHNLLQSNTDFISFYKPVCNILSIENAITKNKRVDLPKDISFSAWLPIEDQDLTINWGYNLLKKILFNLNTNISTTKYPSEQIISNINIFMAHGEKDAEGFKAILTSSNSEDTIRDIAAVFGKGDIAILFICNSASMNREIFSQSLVSFSNNLLLSGYKAVVAPFWRMDVTMSPIWLNEFIKLFKNGFSINHSVYGANKKLSQYDEETSSLFYAPTGWACMHLYGNPNIYWNSN